MQNPRLAARYAKSLLDLAIEQNSLEVTLKDMQLLDGICKESRDFVNMLRSPVIKPTAKGKIIDAVTKERVSVLTTAFIQLLVNKARETNLPEIATTYIDQFNALRNIHKVKITTADPITDDMLNAILANVKASAKEGQTFEVETAVNNELIGGFLLETSGTLVDASILRDLKDIHKQFMNNDYLHRIR